ncbi:MAG: hypothetical protein K0B15_00325 [Lentimicrobium sp.]|nr:hypothetical protein [Lentimicrobium sp.]
MNVKLLTVFIFLISAFFNKAEAQKFTADTTGLVLGRQINMTLELEVDKEDRVEWPLLTDTLTSAIEIIRKSKIDSTQHSSTGKIILRQNLAITSFDTGYHVIPPVIFKIFSSGSQEYTLRETEPLLISVSGVKVDPEAEIKDLKPVLEAPFTFRDFLPWIFGLLGIIIIGILVWLYLKSRKNNKPLIKITLRQPKPSHQIALEELELLKARQLWQKGQVKEYYSQLTDILRDYFEARFGVNALEMTSDEILSAMKDHLSDAQRYNDLQRILEFADMAKFAKARPLGSENELSFTLSVAIVNGTRPAPDLKAVKPEVKSESLTGDTKTED